MLYARCGNCAAVVPLWCSGQFMPHVPMAPVATPHGAMCSMCGVLPPVFTCGVCWCRQFLLVQGAQPPSPRAVGPGQVVASAVQAPQGATRQVLSDSFAEFLKSMAGELGSRLGQAVGGSAW